MLFDNSINNQIYIEDCEVCSNPIEVHPIFKNFTLVNLDIHSIE